MEDKLRISFRRLFISLLGIYLATLIASLACVVTFTYYYKRELAEVLTHSSRNSLVVRDVRQAFLFLERSTGSHFNAIGFFDQKQSPIFLLPPQKTMEDFNTPPFWSRTVSLPIIKNKDDPATVGELRFLFSPYQYTHYALLIWLAVLLVSIPLALRAKKRIIREHEEALRNQKTETYSLLARQVAHDIRSPLASLIAVGHSAKHLDEESRINLRNGVNRIRDIANALLEKGKTESLRLEGISLPRDSQTRLGSPLSSEEKRVELVSELIESAVSQKRLQYSENPSMEIDAHLENSYGLFVEVQSTEWSRLLSNLMNNAIEAMPQGGQIEVSAIESQDQVIVEIRDNGQGMSPEVLAQLGRIGFSHGKEGTQSGSGLGVAHAMATVESWGGKLHYESKLGQGTRAILSLPKAQTPHWFAGTIEIKDTQATVVILDDDPGIHSIWKRRFSEAAPKTQLLHFDSSEEILSWFRENLGAVDQPLYLCDYELIGSKNTGLEVIEMLGIAREAILVTSRADEPELRTRCERQGLRLLPKALSASVPIRTL